MVIEALDCIEADICVLCSKGNAPQLIDATYLQSNMQFNFHQQKQSGQTLNGS